jgi:hypothetical protein
MGARARVARELCKSGCFGNGGSNKCYVDD